MDKLSAFAPNCSRRGVEKTASYTLDDCGSRIRSASGTPLIISTKLRPAVLSSLIPLNPMVRWGADGYLSGGPPGPGGPGDTVNVASAGFKNGTILTSRAQLTLKADLDVRVKLGTPCS